MAKIKDVYNVRVYISKVDYLEWTNVEDLEYESDNTVSFFDKNGQEITVNAPAQLMVITKREEVIVG